MNYDEKLKKILGIKDPFWVDQLKNFIEKTYENQEQGIKDLENLAKDNAKFNEFTRQLLKRSNDLKGLKDEFMMSSNINIIIKFRFYNGLYNKGNILSNISSFNLINNNAIITSSIEFCIDTNIEESAKLKASIPFIMNNEEILTLKDILNKIETIYQPYNKETNKMPLPEYLKFIDIKINNVQYCVKSNDELLLKLQSLIKVDYTNKAISKSYQDLLNI